MNPATVPPLGACRLLGAVVLALFMVSAFTPAANLAGARMADPARLEPAEAIVVLGGSSDVWQDGMLGNLSLRRALRGILLYRDGLAPLLVFMGRQGEVEARSGMARELGVPSTAVVAASGSNTTRDEALRAHAVLGPKGVRTILLVTDSQHMIRARRLFERAGFEVLPAWAEAVSMSADAPEGRLALTRVICGEILARLYYRVARYR